MCILTSEKLLARVQVGRALYADDDYIQTAAASHTGVPALPTPPPPDRLSAMDGGRRGAGFNQLSTTFVVFGQLKFKKNKRNAVGTDPYQQLIRNVTNYRIIF